MIELLQRDQGARLDELIAATGWLPHTARAALTGLRHRGYDVRLERGETGRASVYRAVAERIIQASLFDIFAGHEIGRELKAMSEWLDGHPTLVGLVADDLRRDGFRETGRRGLPAESALRCGLLKQHRQLSYEELAFHLEDSSAFRAFARLPLSWTPKNVVAVSHLRPVSDVALFLELFNGRFFGFGS